jgi:hypothetical protein
VVLNFLVDREHNDTAEGSKEVTILEKAREEQW